EAKEAQEKLLKQLGIEDFESAKEGLQKFREWQEAQKTEAEKQAERLKKLEESNQTLANENETLKAQLAALEAGVNPDSVADVVVLAKNMMSDDLNMKGAIQKVLEKYPHFKASAKEEQKPTFTTGEHKKSAGVDPFIAGLGLNKEGGDSTMANAINYAEQYRSELDQVLKQNMLTNELETPNVVWMGAKTFHVPTLGVTGYQDHSRNGGWNRGNVTVEHEPYTLQFDRDVEFVVDQMDVDESNQAASAASITRVFIEEQAGPEVDAYRFGKMAQHAIAEGNVTEEDVDATSVYQRLKADILKVRKYGP